MIVCVCKVVSDRQIRKAIQDGACTFDDLQVDLGVGIKCGSCVECVHQLLASESARCTSQHAHSVMFFHKLG